MKMICLGSSSAGNSYILKSSTGESLVLECGVPIKELKKALNFNLANVVGALVSHVHMDHFGRVKEYCKAGIDVLMEFENMDRIDNSNHRLKFFGQKAKFNLGSFKVMGFPLVHDVHCCGFLIEHPEMGRAVFISDTKYLNFNFPGVNHFMVEANYSLDIMNERLINGSLNGYLKNRIMESHLSLETCKEFLLDNDLSQAKNIILLHLSDGNSDESRFIKEVKELTGKPTYVADKGREFELSINPF